MTNNVFEYLNGSIHMLFDNQLSQVHPGPSVLKFNFLEQIVINVCSAQVKGAYVDMVYCRRMCNHPCIFE